MRRTPLPAGRLKHLVVIETPVRAQDVTTGVLTTTWAPLAAGSREYRAAIR